MHKAKSIIIDLMLLFIITIPAFIRILSNQYFSMHDDQHIVRLFLLDQGLRQGYLYPRWVDGLGFGFGYPLYNFYPPLVYYIGELFHLLGFSLIWSIKLVFILGFYLGAFGIYLLVKKFTNRLSAFLSATLYTYFFYHAVLIYVRGALAEFLSLAILPFVLLALHNLANKLSLRNGILFGLFLALLILTHPLIALPSMMFIGFSFLFYLLKFKFNLKFFNLFICGLVLGLSLSAFFWLPSLLERKHTLVDQILTSEQASYKFHYIYPQQFIYSPWGYGGSTGGLSDGMTFQLGKIHIGLTIAAVILGILLGVYLSFPRKRESSLSGFLIKSGMTNQLNLFHFFVFLLCFSLFMTTEYSSFVWDRINYLWYLQFPWRFLTFTTIFISIVGGYFIYFLSVILSQAKDLVPIKSGRKNNYASLDSSLHFVTFRMTGVVSFLIIILTIFTYHKYFKPQRLILTTDKQKTSVDEISWRISRTSYEFVPKEVKTKKSELNTTILAIEKKDIPKKPFVLLGGEANVEILDNRFQNKEFLIDAKSSVIFRLNTYNYPGWEAYLTPATVIPSESEVTSDESRNLKIFDNNDFKLITVYIPPGKYNLNFIFKNTPVRHIANLLSLATFVSLVMLNLFQHLFRHSGFVHNLDPESSSG
ncbi:glycosyltransferase family 39 protein [Candidatus Roizmanbacteria bacterium]|nr:glycosyltransferase family 39 protein [Candidatus Roizmanbacteria bacterium]